jgi:hypothetical protein
LAIRELNNELIVSIVNPSSSNNYREEYSEDDLEAQAAGKPGSRYRFEGYKVFQLKDPSVSVTDLGNSDKARMIFQCDIKNGVAQIVNQYFQPELTAIVAKEEVLGEDKGLKHTFRISTDAFATGDPNLVNHQTYYFMAIAYAYNPDQATFDPYVEGLGKPYLAGRRNSSGGAISVYTAIPHNPAPEAQGLVLNTTYGDGPEIQRINGVGNGFNLGSERNALDLRQDQVDDILFNATNPSNTIQYPIYQRAKGPVDVRVYDAVKVIPADYELWLTDTTKSNGRWVLKSSTSSVADTSEKTLEFPYDQLFPKYGFYVSMNQVDAPGDYQAGGNGFIEATKEYTNNDKRWLTGVVDLDNVPQLNWIRSGTATSPADYKNVDDQEFYENALGGTWAPFRLCANDIYVGTNDSDIIAPAPPRYWVSSGPTPATQLDSLSYLCGVDVVLTSDKSKWSRCVVFETQNTFTRSEGRQVRNMIRRHPSVDIDGNYSTVDSGFSWFPGYAINVETGERLNIAFGEDSYLADTNGFVGQTGRDMKYNPTSTQVDDATGRLIFGGKHYIYVFGNKRSLRYPLTADTTYYGGGYDGCQRIWSLLWNIKANNSNGAISAANQNKINRVWKDCMWVSCSYTAPGQQPLASDVKVRLRVARPYRMFAGTSDDTSFAYRPYYKFNTNALTAKVQQTEVAKNALSLINIVPNPYYAYSTYEKNQLDNRVRITNLPSNCTISIYTTSGILVRQLRRDAGLDNTAGSVYPDVNIESSVDWDLKNAQNIPVASGLYIIHIDAPGIGERTLKWFGVMRPIDLDTF